MWKACLVLVATLAFAADTFYIGTWKIASAVLAPWTDPLHKNDAAEMKSLVGKIVIFKPNEIAGPRQVARKDPKYQVKDYPADMLYQGAFDEMKRRDYASIPRSSRPSWDSEARRRRRSKSAAPPN